MKIPIRGIRGENITIDVDPNDTVKYLKTLGAHKINLKVNSKLRALLKGRHLEDTTKISELDIGDAPGFVVLMGDAKNSASDGKKTSAATPADKVRETAAKRAAEAEKMSNTELKAELKRMRIRSDHCVERKDLLELYKLHIGSGANDPAVLRRPPPNAYNNRNNTSNNSNSSTSDAPIGPGAYVNGRPVANNQPTPGLFGVPWTIVIGCVAVAWMMMSNSSLDVGETSGHGWAYTEKDIEMAENGDVLDCLRHEQLLGALEYHRDVTGLPVIIDFSMVHCGPCKMMLPIFTKMAKEFAGKAVFLKVDTTINRESAQALKVRAMPTFVFAVNGKQMDRFAGGDPNRLRMLTEQAMVKAELEKPTVDKIAAALIQQDDAVDGHDEAMTKAKALVEGSGGKPGLVLKEVLAGKTKVSDNAEGGEQNKDVKKPEPPASGDGKKQKLDKDGLITTMLGFLEAASSKLQETIHQQPQASSGDDGHHGDGSCCTEKSINEMYITKDEYQQSIKANGLEAEKVVIVGGGPAGLSAAIYAARAGLNPIMVAPRMGGQLLGKGVEVENYPGLMGSHATGPGVVKLMRAQAASFNTRVLDDYLVDIDTTSRPFKLHLRGLTPDGKEEAHTVLSETVILATGAESRWLDVPGEHEFRGKGVSSCATCDGYLFKGDDVLVVGGGDAAMEDALVLARTSKQVTLVHRRDTFRASNILAEKVKSNDKIKIIWDTVVESFHGDEASLTHVRIRNLKSREVTDVHVQAAFVSIGHIPATNMLKGKVDMDGDGYLNVGGASANNGHFATQSSVPGIFAAGDVSDKVYRQAVTSAGTGAMAALDAERWLGQQTTAV